MRGRMRMRRAQTYTLCYAAVLLDAALHWLTTLLLYYADLVPALSN
jgi:hypothetical protein